MNETVKATLMIEREKLSKRIRTQEAALASAQKRADLAEAKLRLLRPRLADIDAHLSDGGVNLRLVA